MTVYGLQDWDIEHDTPIIKYRDSLVFYRFWRRFWRLDKWFGKDGVDDSENHILPHDDTQKIIFPAFALNNKIE